MNIGLDYDDTFTRDPEGWAAFVSLMRNRGHKVFIVTWRTPGEMAEVIHAFNAWSVVTDGNWATSRKAKQAFMYEQGVRIDVWVDDNPSAILHTMEGWYV